MPRYLIGQPVKQPRSDWWDNHVGSAMLPALNLPDAVNVDTGLVDIRGNPILRAPEPMGFHGLAGKPRARS